MLSAASFRGFAGAATLSVAVLAGATVAATHPAGAAGATAALAAAVNAVTCATNNACISGKNTAFGPGVAGSSARGTGVNGVAMQPYSSGVTGSNSTTQEGGIGVTGTAKGIGIGVFGQAPGGSGVLAETTTGTGVSTFTSSGTGLFTEAASGVGLFSESSTGTAISAYAGTGSAVAVQNSGAGALAAVVAQNFTGNGGDFFGAVNGLIARAPGAKGFPIVATDENARSLFYVSGSGDVYYRGALHHLGGTAGSATVATYSPSSTGPTVEDTGTAELAGGAAAVRLDPAFAASIDARSGYRVFVTADGDTPHGLYVAAKTPNGFVVREAQNGRSTIAFDYRIVATALGQAGQRMSLTGPAAPPQATLPARPARPVEPLHP